MSRDAPSIRLEGLGHRYGSGRWLFRDIDTSISSGMIAGVIGPSGSGKSTLLAICGQLLRPAEGRVIVSFGRDDIGWVYQSPSGVPSRRIVDQTALPLLGRGVKIRPALERAHRSLSAVGLEHRALASYRELSGGEMQRFAFARALAADSPVTMVDEPTAALDRATALTIADLLIALRRPDKLTLIATHDPLVIERVDLIVDLGQ